MYRFKEILIIESNPLDISWIKEAFDGLPNKYNLKFISDGIEAINLLNEEIKYSEMNANHSIILLGLDLTSKSGNEVLKEIKQNDKLRHLPVIVLNSSIDQLTNLYNNGANCVIEKPKNLENFVIMIKEIEQFWLKTAQLPVF